MSKAFFRDNIPFLITVVCIVAGMIAIIYTFWR
jgi:hypothetical protein